ncbi:MAG: serine/threonine-protein kinase [Planctomycetota bacterium]
MTTRRVLGGYRLERALGAGGMGQVFVARDAEGRRVALKVQRAGDARRWRREVEALARLEHPHVTRLLHAEQGGGVAFLVTELVEGPSLGEVLRTRGPLPAREAATLALQVTRALAHAHARGVLHRDLKPDNVVLTPAGEAKLIDFGLACAPDARARAQDPLTRTGAVVGTPCFLAPEQLGDARALSPRTDVFGVGALLFALLTGRPPVSGDSPYELYLALGATQRSPSALRPDLPPALEEVVLRCLERDPAARFASCAELARALAAFLEPAPLARATQGAAALGGGQGSGGARRRRAARGLALVAGAALALLAGLACGSAALPPTAAARARPTLPPPPPTLAEARALCARGVRLEHQVPAGAADERDSPYLVAAVRCYRRAAAVLPEAAFDLARCLRLGRGLAPDAARALRWYRRAAAAGLAPAMQDLGECLRLGVGTTRDLPAARRWHRRAAEAGQADSACLLAEVALATGDQGPDLELALRWLRRAARGEHAPAMNLLGLHHLLAATERDEGLRWLRRAAGAGSALAMRNLALLLPPSDEAARWLSRAAEAGDAPAMRLLATHRLLARDPWEAERWSRAATAREAAQARPCCFAPGPLVPSTPPA